MHSRTTNVLLALGFDTELISKIASKHHTVDALRALPIKALLEIYTKKESELIQSRIKRQPIPDEVLENVIAKADGVCCFCADGNKARAYQIHHAEEYSKTQDNSEENLILICPTHHQSIPKINSAEEQKASRRIWHAVVQVASAYRKQGIDFPYGLFVSLDYGLAPSPEELITRYRVSNSTALAVAQHETTLCGLAQLHKNGFLTVAGASGAGKTTLATGIMGRLWREGMPVYSYQPSAVSRHSPLQDVLLFMHLADRPCVLLLDDANRFFLETDLTQIATASNKNVKVVATWTRDSLAEDPKSERHLAKWLFVNWELLRPTVYAFLASHEPVIVVAIHKRQEPHELRRIGVGYLDDSLQNRMRRYGDQARTISEFLFLLGGGVQTVQADIQALADEGRSDIPVLYAAIEQIAGFEKTVKSEEASDACNSINVFGAPPATAAWVQEVFEAQCKRGRMQEVRGEFKTLHRDWAARLIGAGLSSDRTKNETARLLTPNLDFRTAEPNRISRLWSWLWYDPYGGPFVVEWLERQSDDDWEALVGRAVAAGLEEVGFVAERMHILFRRDTWLETIRKAFAPHQNQLSLAIANSKPTDWHSLRGLAYCLEHACADLAAPIIEAWPPDAVARMIEQTNPDEYGTVGSVINSYKKHSAAWVKEVGKCIQWDTISARIQDVRVGDLNAVFECQSLLTKLGIPLRASMVRRYVKALTDTLREAHLVDIQVGGIHVLWQLFFHRDLQHILIQLPATRFAEDLGKAGPREWRKLAELSGLFAIETQFFQAIIDAVDFIALASAVKKHMIAGCAYELRCLLWVLTRGREDRRHTIAQLLYFDVLEACRRDTVERPMIYEAFRRLHSKLGEKLFVDAGITDKEINDAKEDEDDAPETGIEDFREQLAKFDAAGGDYIINFNEMKLEKIN